MGDDSAARAAQHPTLIVGAGVPPEGISAVEALRASNEGREATGEQLKALNDELAATNARLKEKLDQLELANDDLYNLFFTSPRLATVFLDKQGEVRRFTPAARELLALTNADVGRRVSEIERELFQNELADEAASVLSMLTAVTRELHTREGRWIERQVLPYRTEDQRIAGVVVSFVDVSDFRRAELLLKNRETQQAVVSNLGIKALEADDLSDFLDQAVREVARALGTDQCGLFEVQPGRSRLLLRSGVGWLPGTVHQTPLPIDAANEAGFALRGRTPTLSENLQQETRFEPSQLLRDHACASGLSCVVRGERGAYGLIAAYSALPGRFSEDDSHFLQAVANLVGSTITRRQFDLRSAIEQQATSILAEAHGLDEAFARVLRTSAALLGASICEVWKLAPSGQALYCEEFLSPARPGKREAFRELLGDRPIARGEGVIGEVWDRGRAQWLTNVPDGLDRGAALKELGISGLLAFPILARDEFVGAMVFLLEHHLTWDEQLLASLERIGQNMGKSATAQRATFERAHLAEIVNSSNDAVLSKNLEGIIQSWNLGAERIYGYTATEVVGQSVALLFPPEIKDELKSILSRVASGTRIESYETVRLRKDGTHIDVSITVSPIRDDDRFIIGASAIARDITERKRAEKKLEEADRQKDQFLAMLGHELRNPLAAVRSATELLKLKPQGDPTLKRVTDILDRQTRHMAQLMDGLLDVSRIIRNKIELQWQAVNLSKLVHEVIDDHAIRTQQANLELHVNPGEQPCWVSGDPIRLTQVVDNLVTNAVKFTGAGGEIFVTLERHAAETVLSVRDTGRGIAPELLPHVFDVFRQAKQSLDRTSGGLGLGLALVRLLTELHGGSVAALSEGPNRGAEFVVRLPAADAPAPGTTAKLELPANSLQVLVVEDNPDAATLLCDLLHAAGHDAMHANTAQKAWQALEERSFQVVLCDLGLPGGMTGFDLSRKIRQDPRFDSLRVIALSGYGRPVDKVQSEEAGFHDHVTKPVDLDTLRRVLTSARR